MSIQILENRERCTKEMLFLKKLVLYLKLFCISLKQKIWNSQISKNDWKPVFLLLHLKRTPAKLMGVQTSNWYVPRYQSIGIALVLQRWRFCFSFVKSHHLGFCHSLLTKKCLIARTLIVLCLLNCSSSLMGGSRNYVGNKIRKFYLTSPNGVGTLIAPHHEAIW
jgi:hypothetical protein